jgi:ABC-type glycerol-3-phosphate transport system substrate-binding protein
MKVALKQLHNRALRTFFAQPQTLVGPILIPFLIAAGCIERPTTLDPVPDRPHAGVVLTAAVSDPADRDLLRQLARAWGTRSGAEIRTSDAPWDGTADIGLIRSAEMPRWAEAGQLRGVPAALKSADNDYRWDDLIPVYSLRLLTWGERTFAVPLTGEGMVLVYRKDAFDGKAGRPAAPPATWDELAGFAAREFKGQKYLPPLPATADRLQAEFFAAAASYDRPAVGRLGPNERPGDPFFAFQFDPTGGTPRLTAKAFERVADLYRQMQPARSAAADAATAFRTGEAKVGILTLAELGEVGPDAANKLGVAPLPGSRVTFDANGQEQPTGQGSVNRVPYLGWGARVGVVSTRCAAPDAAWDFLEDVGQPDRTALELVAARRWGAGPYRVSQFETRARARWFGYGLMPDETERLTNSLRDNMGFGVQNYRLRLRTPNQHELTAALDAELRTAIQGQTPPAEALKTANDRWTEIIRRQPGWRDQARKSLGLGG